MTDKELLVLCKDFMKGLIPDGQTKDKCFMAVIALTGFLSFYGVKCREVEGYVGESHHWWIELQDGRIIDPTADQFKYPVERRLPAVYIGVKPGWYKKMKV